MKRDCDETGLEPVFERIFGAQVPVTLQTEPAPVPRPEEPPLRARDSPPIRCYFFEHHDIHYDLREG